MAVAADTAGAAVQQVLPYIAATLHSQRCHMLSSARIVSLLSHAWPAAEHALHVCVLIGDSLEAVPCGAVQVHTGLSTPLICGRASRQRAISSQHRRHQAGCGIGLRGMQAADEAGPLQQGTNLRGVQGQARQRRLISLGIHPAELQRMP